MRTYTYTLILTALVTLPLSAQVTPLPSSSLPPEPRAAYAQSNSYGAVVPSANYALRGKSSRNNGQTVFIIPAGPGPTTRFAAMKEDLHVMCRIFDKIGSPDTAKLPLLGTLFTFESPRETEALYLQGYGVIFFMKVPFPLDFSEPEQTTETSPSTTTDPVWESVKEETLYGRPRSSSINERGKADAHNRQNTVVLEERLLQILKHASNIRDLKPDEKIVVRVTGQGQAETRPGRSRRRRTGSNPYGGVYGSYDAYGSTDRALPELTTLIAHTTKAEVDAYNTGQLTFEQFKGKTQLTGLDGNNVDAKTVTPVIR